MSNASTIEISILNNILESIQKIEIYLCDIVDFEELSNNTKVYDAVLMNFIVIGEMVSKLSAEFKKSHNDVKWNKIKNLRNIIAHNYFGVDPEEVWEIARIHLLAFKKQVEEYF